jgi:hypothetical protein
MLATAALDQAIAAGTGIRADLLDAGQTISAEGHSSTRPRCPL